MEKIQVLQLGERDWSECYTLPEEAEFCYIPRLKKAPKKLYDLVILDRCPLEAELPHLEKSTRAYTLFVTEETKMTDKAEWFYKCKKGKRISRGDIQDFLSHEVRNYFSRSYGEKFRPQNLTIAQGFSGSVRWDGGYQACLKGDFGAEFHQAVLWRNNIPIWPGQCLDMWLEYQKDRAVSIALTVFLYWWGDASGTPGYTWKFTEEEIDQGIRIDSQWHGALFVSLSARGEGELRIIGLHDRHSRRGHGLFIPGGEKHITSAREEVFSYFDPGDMRPPLTVYFSGYKTQEGFEGYYMMRKMGCPFLLIAEARLEGGGFYMGSEEYENLLLEVIERSRKELGFTRHQVLLAGMSMGSFGALYYGCDIRPHAILLGKPLASIGDVASNEKLFRPGVFPTSLDVLRYLCGSLDEKAVRKLNERFWDKFDKTDWGESRIISAYMIEDDYDMTAYPRLIAHLHSDGAQLYGKGLHGRHNDNSAGIVEWFVNRMKQTLREDFHRKVEG